jgi:hypothetical protein
MKALTYLLGARSLDVAYARGPRPAAPEAAFAPLASTPETAAAWRRWAEAGRAMATSGADGARVAAAPWRASRAVQTLRRPQSTRGAQV